MQHEPAFAMLHSDGKVCVPSVHPTVVGAIANWAAAHGDGHFPQMPDDEVWGIYQKYIADGGECRLAAVTITPQPGEIRSLAGGRGDA